MAPPSKPLTGPDDPRHGTTSGYRYGCRQPCCRTAIAAYMRDRKQIRLQLIADGYDLADLAHGEYVTYVNWRCRCVPCVEAYRAYENDLRASKRHFATTRTTRSTTGQHPEGGVTP